jgi:hypothetical protein
MGNKKPAVYNGGLREVPILEANPKQAAPS